MGSWQVPTRSAHKLFCENDHWIPKRTVRGKHGDHYRYELVLDDGAVLYTRISHPPDKSTYGPQLWSEILRTQLRVTEDELGNCVNGRARPGRGKQGPQEELARQLPAWLVAQLLREGVPEGELVPCRRPRPSSGSPLSGRHRHPVASADRHRLLCIA